jgi:hypothetical protein
MALGVVLTPYGHIPESFPTAVDFDHRGAKTFRTPFDPRWYERGEAGMYYDTQLGATPTDFELSRRVGFMPVKTGWVVTKQGYLPGRWYPPDGGWPGQPALTRSKVVPFDRYSLRGLGETEPQPIPLPPSATADDVLAVMAAHNDRVFALALVSTTAVTISALITLLRTLKLLREGRSSRE